MLRSTTHPLTPHAWATIVTGVNAGRHGIWDFTERDETGYQLRLVNGSFRRAPAVWDRLAPLGPPHRHRQRPLHLAGARGRRASPIAGFDAAAREQGLTYPDELRAELRQRFGSLELDHSSRSRTASSTSTSSAARRRRRSRSSLWLADRFDPELLFVVFMAADHIHHLCWTDWEARRPREPGRRGLPDPRRGDRRARRARRRRTATSWSSPTTARARSTASSTSTPGSPREGFLTYATRRRRRRAEAPRARRSSSAATCRNGCATRPSSACRACASAVDRARRLHRARLGAHAGVLVRDVRQHRPQRARPRGAGDRRARRGVRARPRRDRRARCSSCAAPTASAIVAAGAPARGPLPRARARQGPRPARRVRPTTPGSARATSRARSTRSGTRSRSRAAASTSYVGSHRHEGVIVLAGPRSRRAPRSAAS